LEGIVATDLNKIIEDSALRNPETAFNRGWKGGVAFERERIAKAVERLDNTMMNQTKLAAYIRAAAVSKGTNAR
jgi:hypothetical protein